MTAPSLRSRRLRDPDDGFGTAGDPGVEVAIYPIDTRPAGASPPASSLLEVGRCRTLGV